MLALLFSLLFATTLAGVVETLIWGIVIIVAILIMLVVLFKSESNF